MEEGNTTGNEVNMNASGDSALPAASDTSTSAAQPATVDQPSAADGMTMT